MIFDKGLLTLDYLTFSSHKSATQSMVKTLNKNGFRCKHCHVLPDMDLPVGSLPVLLDAYIKQNNKKLAIISTFREPIDRLISSFFQYYGIGVVRKGMVGDKNETIISKLTIDQLQEIFVHEYCENTEIGTHESIALICNELGIRIDDLIFDRETNYGFYEGGNFKLLLFRFDILVNHFPDLLTTVTGREITIHERNMSDSRWYKEIRAEFRQTLSIPPDIISRIYSSRKGLINVFYQGGYESLLSSAVETYGSGETRAG